MGSFRSSNVPHFIWSVACSGTLGLVLTRFRPALVLVLSWSLSVLVLVMVWSWFKRSFSTLKPGWLVCSFPQVWITTARRCLSTANVFSSTCSLLCPVTTTSRPSPQFYWRRANLTERRPSHANPASSQNSYLQVRKWAFSFTQSYSVFSLPLFRGKNLPINNRRETNKSILQRIDTFLIRGENIWTLCQKQYWAQRTSKVLIKAFHYAISVLLPKLGPSALAWARNLPMSNICFANV